MSVHPTIEFKTKNEYIKSSIIIKYATICDDIIKYTDENNETHREKIYAYILISSTTTGLYKLLYIITINNCIKYLFLDFKYLTDVYDLHEWLKTIKKNLEKNNIIEIQ